MQELPSLSAQDSPRAAGGEGLGLKEQAPSVVPSVLLLHLAGWPGTLLTTEAGWQQRMAQGTSAG